MDEARKTGPSWDVGCATDAERFYGRGIFVNKADVYSVDIRSIAIPSERVVLHMTPSTSDEHAQF